MRSFFNHIVQNGGCNYTDVKWKWKQRSEIIIILTFFEQGEMFYYFFLECTCIQKHN